MGAHYDEPETNDAVPVPVLDRLRARIVREADVKVLHRLEDVGMGRFAYLIETPFMTFPRFVVGTTDADNEEVMICLKCGLLASAEEEFGMNWGGSAVSVEVVE